MVRKRVASLDGSLAKPLSLAGLAMALSAAAQTLAGDAAWRGPAGRMAAELLADLQASDAAAQLTLTKGLDERELL